MAEAGNLIAACGGVLTGLAMWGCLLTGLVSLTLAFRLGFADKFLFQKLLQSLPTLHAISLMLLVSGETSSSLQIFLQNALRVSTFYSYLPRVYLFSGRGSVPGHTITLLDRERAQSLGPSFISNFLLGLLLQTVAIGGGLWTEGRRRRKAGAAVAGDPDPPGYEAASTLQTAVSICCLLAVEGNFLAARSLLTASSKGLLSSAAAIVWISWSLFVGGVLLFAGGQDVRWKSSAHNRRRFGFVWEGLDVTFRIRCCLQGVQHLYHLLFGLTIALGRHWVSFQLICCSLLALSFALYVWLVHPPLQSGDVREQRISSLLSLASILLVSLQMLTAPPVGEVLSLLGQTAVLLAVLWNCGVVALKVLAAVRGRKEEAELRAERFGSQAESDSRRKSFELAFRQSEGQSEYSSDAEEAAKPSAPAAQEPSFDLRKQLSTPINFPPPLNSPLPANVLVDSFPAASPLSAPERQNRFQLALDQRRGSLDAGEAGGDGAGPRMRERPLKSLERRLRSLKQQKETEEAVKFSSQ